jgi:hypothetical protein
MKNQTDHEEARETLWRETFVAVSKSESSLDVSTCVNWVDQALAAFDQRFSPDAHKVRGEKLKKDAEKQKTKEKRNE